MIVVALREHAEQIQKLLRSYEFEIVSFEPMTGTVAELIREYEQKLADARRQFDEQRKSVDGAVRQPAQASGPLRSLSQHARAGAEDETTSRPPSKR